MTQKPVHRSFRISADVMRRLERRAKETSESVNALVGRYLDESLRTDDHPHVHFWSRPGGRRPMLVGHRLSVADVIETVANEGGSAEAAAAYLGLPLWKVETCLRYYAEFTEEIDDEIAGKSENAEREHEAWRRRQEALGG